MIISQHDRKVLLAMQKHCSKAVSLTARFSTYEEFIVDEDAPAALAMYLSQIGELAKVQLSDEAKSYCTMIPWKNIYGLRNRIVHGYGELEFIVIWQSAVEDVPALSVEIASLLSKCTEPKSFVRDMNLDDE